MAGFKQYTSCSQPSQWMSPAAYVALATAALAVVFTAAGIGTFPCGLLLIEAFAMAGTIAFCDWWLNVRLVCLGGDKSVIGMVIHVEPATGKKFPGNFDTDYSINLLVYPTMPGVTQPELEASVPYGYLAAETDGVRDHVGFFRGEFAEGKNGRPARSAILHAEFEGAGMRDLRAGLLVAYGLALAAWIVCAAVPVVGWIIGIVLAILALLAALIGGLLGLGDTGDPSDVEGAPTEIHQPDDHGLNADLLYVRGRWVFDSLHEGWNELHPIKACTRVGQWSGAWPANTVDLKDRLDNAFDASERNDIVERQKQPQHRWTVHPLVDGCDESTRPPSDDTPVIR